jgi:hypothetical protein
MKITNHWLYLNILQRLMTAIGSVKLKFCRGLLAGFLMEQCRIHSTDTKYVPLNHIGVAMVTPLINILRLSKNENN